MTDVLIRKPCEDTEIETRAGQPCEDRRMSVRWPEAKESHEMAGSRQKLEGTRKES